MSTRKILITGATGYIGGAILASLLESPNAKNYEISALVRKAEHVTVLAGKGVRGILFKSLDDLTAIKKAASENDVVINAASASHDKSTIAIIEGLAERKDQTGVQTAIIHTSGTSILADRPVSGKWVDTRIHSDLDDIYHYEKTHPETYSQRVVDVAVVEMGEKLGVATCIIVPPTIYGKGNGFFATISQQIPNLTRLAIRRGQVFALGKGEGIWNHVHILDLTSLYSLILQKFLSGSPISLGKAGIYFAETGEHTWLEVSQGIARAAVKQGLLKDDKIGSIGVVEAAKEIGTDEGMVELGLDSNSRARADLSRQIGWKPTRGNDDFYRHFEAEIETVVKEFK